MNRNFVGMIRKIVNVKSALGLVIVGLIFAILSVVLLIATVTDNDHLPIDATIAEIQESEDEATGETIYKVYVDYTLGHDEYRHIEFGGYDSGWEVGDVITVEYDVAHPDQIQSTGGFGFGLIALGIGVIAIYFGLMRTRRAMHDEY